MARQSLLKTSRHLDKRRINVSELRSSLLFLSTCPITTTDNGLLLVLQIIRSGVVLQQLKDQDRDFDESEADDEYRGQKKDKDFESFVALQLGRGRVCHRNQRLSR